MLRRVRWGGLVAGMGEMGDVYTLLVGTPEGNTPPGRPSHTWVDNIKLHIKFHALLCTITTG
jgi:hypothetical protein